jgi:hypothetical protein
MQFKSVLSEDFIPYGIVLPGYDTAELVETLEKHTEKPADRVIYVPSEPKLEALPVFRDFQDRVYGGLPIQFGYCNGFNTKLNCFEYHRGCEVCIPADDIILLLAKLQDLKDHTLNTAKVEAFIIPRGTAALTYETTLHYAPARKDGPFRTVIVLPRGTNTPKPELSGSRPEDLLLRNRNKWLIAHPDAPDAKDKTVFVGLTGKNIDIGNL